MDAFTAQGTNIIYDSVRYCRGYEISVVVRNRKQDDCEEDEMAESCSLVSGMKNWALQDRRLIGE